MPTRRAAHEGSIYKRSDGRWAASITVGYEGSKRLRRTLYGKSQAAVREALQQARTDLRQGVAPAPQRLTVGAYLEDWLRTVEPTLRPNTHASYADLARRHIIPGIGRLRLGKLTPQHVRDLIADRLATGLSPRSVQYVHAILRRALNQALRDGDVTRNVATLVDAPRVRRPEIRPLTVDEAATLRDAARGERLAPLWTLATTTGLRQGELLALRWQDVDLDARTASVRHTLQRVPKAKRSGKGPHYVLAEPKTDHSRRTIHLPDMSATALREHRLRQLEERLQVGTAWQEWDLVFASTIGTPLDGRNVAHRFEDLLRRAGVRRIRFHDLRHTCATFQLLNGTPMRVVMENLGHSQIGTTANLYSHVLPSMQRDSADRMDALLGGAR